MGPETKMARDDGSSLVKLLIESECARILQERGVIFQFSGLLTSESFNSDEKKVLYFEQKGSSLQTLVYDDKALILYCMENFDQSTGKM